MRKRSETAKQPSVAHEILSGKHRVKPFVWGFLATLGVIGALVLGGLINQLGTVLLYIGIALFISLGLDPIVTAMERKIPRPAAIAAVVLGVLAVFAGILVAIIPVIVEQIANLAESLPNLVNDIMASDWYKQIQNDYGDQIGSMLTDGLKFFQDPQNILGIIGGVGAVTGGIASAVTGTIVVLILTLYFIASLRAMKNTAARFVPAYNRQQFSGLVDDVSGAVGRYVVGQASLAAINGVLTLILMLIIGAPMPALLALIAFIGSMIPMVGTITAAIIISLICLIASPLTAIVSGIWYLIYMQIEAYVLSPRIMNKAVSIPGALVVIAAVGGAAIGQVLGALVAVPVAASILIIVQKVVFPAQDEKLVDPDEELVVTPTVVAT
ncbi:AI-2E family transporter [Microbacterium sp. NC79]|uniref:AI-2E family transporter n=1 Tax=Microbacterium sp. NC79 TaxID=2851009 RepID=UPI001C2BED1F|nr:AI-2E family transporter [Microbacterium sp. NC79]MBV0894485.1 AI-2E family transporter [Microbacterium sp. NC79]